METSGCVPAWSRVVGEPSCSSGEGLSVGPKEESCVAVTEHWEHVNDGAIPVIMPHDTGKRPATQPPLSVHPQLPGPSALSAEEALPRPPVAQVLVNGAMRMAGIYKRV